MSKPHRITRTFSDEWACEYLVEVVDGNPVVSEMRVRPMGAVPRFGLTARLLREIHLSPAYISVELRRRGAMPTPGDTGDTAGLRGSLARRPGRRGYPDEFYRNLVSRYQALVNAGEPKPVKELAAQLGVAPTRISPLLVTARKRGFLTASRPGIAGGRRMFAA